jgi:predicted transposase YbfD/YdcC
MKDSIDCIRESFEDFSEELGDHRMDRCKLYSVEEIFFLTLAAVIAGCDGWRDIERYGKSKLEFLQQFFPYVHGIPSDDTIRRFFRALEPEKFRICFVEWIKKFSGEKLHHHIALDGKVSRHTFDGEGNPLHMVSAFASECRMVLAQEKVADKSNEITAIPRLLDILDIEGAIVTIDAMGCQREIAQLICQKQADYILSLKGNQGTLHQDTELVFQDEVLLKDLGVEVHQTIDGSEHGRLEERIYRVVEIPDVLKKRHDWSALKSLVEVISRREIKGVCSQEKRYYITSLSKDAIKIGKAIRSHWSIENNLHWVLDISFRDDESRIRKGNAPQNICIIKHMALNLLQKAKGKRDSIKQLRKAAGWDNKILLHVLSQI